jgi:hypothetical protein
MSAARSIVVFDFSRWKVICVCRSFKRARRALAALERLPSRACSSSEMSLHSCDRAANALKWARYSAFIFFSSSRRSLLGSSETDLRFVEIRSNLLRSPNQIYSGSYAAIFPTTPPLPRSSPTKKLCGSIGNTTLHSLPGLYLFAISNASSMLSASNATLNLAALLLTSIAILIIVFFSRIDLSRSSVLLGVKQAPLPDGYLFVGHVAIFSG